MDKFKKKILTLRQLLIGREFYNALTAMEFAARWHKGVRKDKVTPEFDHQVSIALFALTLPKVSFQEELIAVIMLHDVMEDYNISESEIRDLFDDPKFANTVVRSVINMTKVHRDGTKKDEALLFDAMAQDKVASIAKLCDRIHNFKTMVDVFTIEKQREYIEEGKTYFMPMLKKAKRNFPHQTMVYENLKHLLEMQMDLITEIHKAHERTG